MKYIKNPNIILMIILFSSFIITSCKNSTIETNKNETTTSNETETKETIKEYVTNNDVFVIDENSDKPKPNNGYPTNTPPGFVNPDGSIPGVPKNGGPAPVEKPETYTAVHTYDKSDTISNLKIESTGKDENAILVDNKSNIIRINE